MLSAEQNDLITRTASGTAAGNLMRRYWQPAALVDELAGNRPVKPVRLLGEDLVAFKDDKGRYGLIGRHCPHRGTDLAYGPVAGKLIDQRGTGRGAGDEIVLFRAQHWQLPRCFANPSFNAPAAPRPSGSPAA